MKSAGSGMMSFLYALLFLTIAYLALLFIKKEILHSLPTLYQSGNTALVIAVPIIHLRWLSC